MIKKIYKNGFISMLDEFTEEELIKFHINLTATDIIQTKYICNFQYSNGIFYHTCFNSVDIPINDDLNNKEIKDYLRKFFCL